MKIFVIGGTGVIGSHFVKTLSAENYDLTYTYYKNKLFSTNSIFLDVQDRLSTIKTIHKINPDLVIICNALTGVDFCEQNPELTNSINVKGTQNIIDGCKQNNCKVVFISTSAVFDGTKKNILKMINQILLMCMVRVVSRRINCKEFKFTISYIKNRSAILLDQKMATY